jgi:glycosyltransferase involved in cell wall biosynthesis
VHGRDDQSGTKAFQVVNRTKFQRKWAQSLATQSPPEPRVVPVARRRRGRGHLLVADNEVPTPDRDAGSRRLTAILQGLVDLGYAVTYLPHNGQRRVPYTRQLERLGVEVFGGPDDCWPLVQEMADGLTHAWVARPHVAESLIPRLRADLPHLPIIYDTVDLHFLREEREAALKGDASLTARAEETRRLELAIAGSVEALLVVSPFERDLLSRLIPSPVYVIPIVHDVGPRRTQAPVSHELLFVGGFRHPPNEDAVEWFVTDVLPRVRRRVRSACFLIAGADITDRVRALESEAVQVLGWVPRLEPLYARVRAAVAPLRYGAGMKGKVGEALSVGVPMAMTTVAAEGMYIENGVHALVADDPDMLADGIVQLLQDDDLWVRLSNRGQRLVEERYSPRAVLPLLEQLLGNLPCREATRLKACAS